MEFTYLVFTRMPGESLYRRRLRSLLLYLCYVFRAVRIRLDRLLRQQQLSTSVLPSCSEIVYLFCGVSMTCYPYYYSYYLYRKGATLYMYVIKSAICWMRNGVSVMLCTFTSLICFRKCRYFPPPPFFLRRKFCASARLTSQWILLPEKEDDCRAELYGSCRAAAPGYSGIVWVRVGHSGTKGSCCRIYR